MAETSSIEWTDATWNPVTGCSVVSPGCTNCYAMKLAGTRLKHHKSRAGLTRDTKAGPVWTGETRVNWEWMSQPLSWTRPRKIFVCAHGDLFHETVAWVDIATTYGIMIAAHHLRGHIFQILTKRAERARQLLNDPDFWEVVNSRAECEIMERVDPLKRRSDDARATCDTYGPELPPPGLWLGVSGENQHWMVQRCMHLVETPAVARFLSYEPALSDLDLEPFLLPVRQWSNGWMNNYPLNYPKHRLDWVICGGESGPGARPMHPDWARSVRDQCAAAGVPFFFKQWGAWAPLAAARPVIDGLPVTAWPNGTIGHGNAKDHGGAGTALFRGTKKIAGRLLDGVTHDGMPKLQSEPRSHS